MTADEARELFEYTEWANGRLFEATAVLSEEQIRQPIESSFGSVRETFAHILSAEWIWLRRFKGDAPTEVPAWAKDSDRAALLVKRGEIESERRSFLARLDDAALARTLEYRLLSGAERRNTLAELVRHVANHSTYHRGQWVTQLRQLGAKSPSTDYIQFLVERPRR